MIGDFDDDGKIDIGVTDNYHTGKIFQNTQAAAGQPITTSSLTQITTTFSVSIAMAAIDIDGDGKLDVTSGYNIYRNKSTSGTIAFDAAISHTSNFSVPAFGDFNKDGKIDFATVSGSNSVTLYQNNSASGAFSSGALSSMANTGVSFVRPTSVQYGALVIAETARGRPHLGRKTLCHIACVLAVDAAGAEASLQGKEHHDHRIIVGQQVQRRDRNCEQRWENHRPTASDTVRQPAPAAA